jgi:hypothetical protein
MKMKCTIVVLFGLLLGHQIVFAQKANNESSNIQKYTPSKLLEKGTWDIKWFNNLYTQTRSADAGGKVSTVPRSSFFNTSLEVFTGISNSKKVNIGLITELRSNTFAGSGAGSVFSFKNQAGKARAGIGHIAPSIKIALFAQLPNFSVQSSFFIPLFDKESNANGFLAQKSFIWQNRFFYDHTFPGRKFQLFSEISTRLFMGPRSKNGDGSFNENGGFANNSVELAPGAFLSYFPNQKFTVLAFAQHAQLVAISNGFGQNYTAVGGGTKYQLGSQVNVELLYSKFMRGTGSGLGQSFNVGLRYIFKR